MNVLDELRETIRWELIDPDYADKIIDAFEAAHPGLVDHTTLCRDCHNPTMDSGDGFTVCPACTKESK